MKRKAFTLVELLVVIGIICILLALILPNFRPTVKVQGTVTNKIQRIDTGRTTTLSVRVNIIEVSTSNGKAEYRTTKEDLYNSIVVGGTYSFDTKGTIFITGARLISLPVEKK